MIVWITDFSRVTRPCMTQNSLNTCAFFFQNIYPTRTRKRRTISSSKIISNNIKKRELTSRADTHLDLHETGLNIGHNIIYLKSFYDFLVKLDGANQTPAMARQYVTTALRYLYFINQTKIDYYRCVNEELLRQ